MRNKITADTTSPNDDDKRLDSKYIFNFAKGFHYMEFPTNTYKENRVLEQNVILFIIDGSCELSYDQYTNRKFVAKDMLFFPKYTMISVHALESIKIIYMTFDEPLNISDKQYIQQLWRITRDITYDFKPLVMNYPIDIFINSLIYLIKNGGDCVDLHEVKHRELFIILRLFYTKGQIAEFFYPVIGESFNFKNFVLENHFNCHTVNELVERSGMPSNTFIQQFKEEFGMSAYQWMLKQVCQKIQHKASEPGVTVKDIMSEVGIKDPTHFNRVCKRHFDQTPKQLIAYYQSDSEIIY